MWGENNENEVNIMENSMEGNTLSYIVDRMKILIKDMQTCIEQYRKQQTDLYWNNVKLQNNRQIWGNYLQVSEEMYNLLSVVISYAEEIQEFATETLSDVEQINEQGIDNIESQQVNFIEQKMVMLQEYQYKFLDSVEEYARHLKEFDELMQHRLEQERRGRKGYLGDIKERFIDFFR